MPSKKHKKKSFGNHAANLVWLFIGIGFLIISAGLIWISNLTLPNLDTFDERKVVTSTKIYDRTGEILLFDFHEDITRTVIPAEEISIYAKQAAVAIEDSRFFEHKGVEIKAIIRAIVTNLKKGDLLGGQGGSTITQQVIKNALLTRDKRVSRKIKEWVLSLRLEQEYSKDQILALYLNEIPYGGTLYGIEEASQSFFSKPASEISLAEAAYLAALPQAPTYYSPFGNNKDQLDSRQKTVLLRMYEKGFITKEEQETALNEVVEFRPTKYSQNSALHFVQYVREYLEAKYGAEVLVNEGLRVITTLDFDLQQKAEEMILRNALENEENYNASNQALVAIEAESGQILTMVGSRDYDDSEIDGNFNVALAKRQPGSSFKPFVYATAFTKGYTPNTVLFDTKTQFSTATGCAPDNLTSAGDCYSPSNYDNKEKGPIILRNALAQSRNIPAVKLLYLVGISDVLRTAREAGIASLSSDPNRYGLTLVLGGGEVSLLDMTSAYGTFSNQGIRAEPQSILRVEDNKGNLLEEFSPNRRRAIDKQAAQVLNDVLSDNQARTPLFGSRSFMYFGDNVQIAAKTGTTNDNRDAWLIGYSSEIAVGVWSGNNDNSSMTKGSSISGKTWREFFLEANKKYPPEDFVNPERDIVSKPILNGEWRGGDVIMIDSISGKLATVYTPKAAQIELVPNSPHSILHWINKDDPRGEIPDNPEKNPQYARWEYGVQTWINKNFPELINTTTTIPTDYDDVHTPETQPEILTENIQNLTIKEKVPLFINPLFESTHPIIKVSYYLNNKLIGTSQNSPFSLNYIPQEADILAQNTIKIVATDLVLNTVETSFSIPNQ